MLSRSEIESLIILLEDPDPDVHLAVSDHMATLGEAAVPIIDEYRALHRHQNTGKLLSAVLHRITFPAIEQEFLTLLDLGLNDLHDLEKAAFLVCRLADPTLRTELYSRRLSSMSQELWVETHFAKSSTDEVRIALNYLFSRYGLKGAQGEHHSSDSSYIHKVLDTKQGIPLSLAMIALFVANRINIPLIGINFPFHFLLAAETDIHTFYIDPTEPYRLLSRKECDQFLQLNGLQPDDSYYSVATPYDMLARFMRNLLAAYQQEKDSVRLRSVTILLEHLNVYHSLR